MFSFLLMNLPKVYIGFNLGVIVPVLLIVVAAAVILTTVLRRRNRRRGAKGRCKSMLGKNENG